MFRQPTFAGVIAGSFAVMSLAGTPSAYADAAGEALVRDALNAISARAGWTASADIVRSEGGKVIVDGLSVENRDMKIELSAASIALVGLNGRDGGYFANGVTAQNLSVSYDMSSIGQSAGSEDTLTSIASIIGMETVNIVDLYLPPVADAAAGESGFLSGFIGFYSYLAKVEMASLNAPVMQLDQAVSVSGIDGTQVSRAIYRDTRMTNWSNGIVARSDLGSVEMTVTGGPEGGYTMSADGAFVEHLDIAHYAHVLDPARYSGGKGDGVWKPLMKRMEYSGLQIRTSAMEMAIARLSGVDFDMRQPEKPFLSGLEDMIASGLSQEKPDEEAAFRIVGEILPAVFSAFRLGEFTLEDLTVQPAEKIGSFSLDRVRLAGYSGAGIDHFSFDGLTASGPDNSHFRIESFSFDGLGFPEWEDIMAFVDSARRGEDPARDPQLAAKIMDLYPSLRGFSTRNFSLSVQGKEPITLDEIRFEATGPETAFLHSGTGSIRGLVVPAVYFDAGGGPNFLKMLNYDRLAMDAVSEAAWNETASEYDYRATLMVEKVGELDVRYGLSGISEASVRQLFVDFATLEASGKKDDPSYMIEIFKDIGLRTFSISFTDRSIVERALGFAASMQGSDGRTYGNQLKGALPFFLSAMPPVDFREDVIAAAQAALDGGQKTTFSLAPGRTLMVPEIAAAAMRDPLSLIDLLGAGMVSTPAN